MRMRAILCTLAAALVLEGSALAISRPHHEHEDLFGEEDLLIGFKVGPQINGFTAVQMGSAVIDVQSSMRPLISSVFKFVYAVPRFEVNPGWNIRGWVNSADSVHSLSFPVLMKLPLEVDEGVDLEFGLGVQNDIVLGGADPHKSFLFGIVGSLGVSLDLLSHVFEFEIRYNVGTEDVSDKINGARHRDYQAMGGLMWHF